MNKAELRKIYKAKRNQLDAGEQLRSDDLMLLQFQQFDYSSVRTLLSYWPIDDHSEPNTLLFSGYLRHIVPGLTIAYPATDPLKLAMDAFAVNEDTVFHTNSLGITEPKEGVLVDPEEVDLVFVPLLIYDRSGYRVGFGKGYYDRYLARCRTDVVKIGFCYFDPIERIPDTDQFDVPLSYCITPHQIYEF